MSRSLGSMLVQVGKRERGPGKGGIQSMLCGSLKLRGRLRNHILFPPSAGASGCDLIRR